MTLDQLKEKIRDYISKAKTKEALDELSAWASQNANAQLVNDVSMLKGELISLSREKTLGLISHGDASTRQNKLTFQLLGVLDGIEPPTSNDLPLPAPANPGGNTRARVYFSYAWEEIDSDKDIVEQLYQSLKREGFEVVRDKNDLEYKDSISGFMREIGRGDFIVVAFSDKYLKSENCMFEMYEIYRNSKLDRDSFSEKIYPIRVESIKLGTPSVLEIYFDHWEKKEKEWRDFIQKRSDRISPAQQDRYQRVKKIATELGDFLDFLSDINAASVAQLQQDNFEIVKKAIREKMG